MDFVRPIPSGFAIWIDLVPPYLNSDHNPSSQIVDVEKLNWRFFGAKLRQSRPISPPNLNLWKSGWGNPAGAGTEIWNEDIIQNGHGWHVRRFGFRRRGICIRW